MTGKVEDEIERGSKGVGQAGPHTYRPVKALNFILNVRGSHWRFVT